jgi:putative FmdB family regulatory protein
LPTYGYRCRSCSTEFEVWQTMRDEPGAACPSCGGASSRLFFPAGIVFKGSGFYKTDSRGASSSSITSDSGDSASRKSSDNSSDKSSDKTSTIAKNDAGTSGASTSTASSDKSSASTDAAR